MNELTRFKWRAFDAASGIKVAIGLVVMMGLTHLTGETWLATGLVALFAWLTNVPGSLQDRICGMLAFAAGAVAMTLVSGQLGLAIWPNAIFLSVIGLVGTLALAWGMRAFMVGWALICWAIYVPFLIAGTNVMNCVLAVLVGTGVLIALSAVAGVVGGNRPGAKTAAPPFTPPRMDFVVAYSITVALVLALTTYYGWLELETDRTLMVGGAFFVIGFDARKTWVAGLGRVLGLLAGVLVGLLIAKILGPGLPLDAIMIAACGLSFATIAVHPGAWMFFFMVFVAAGWLGLDSETFDLTLKERFYGETVGVVVAMVALVFLQWWQNRSSPKTVCAHSGRTGRWRTREN